MWSPPRPASVCSYVCDFVFLALSSRVVSWPSQEIHVQTRQIDVVQIQIAKIVHGIGALVVVAMVVDIAAAVIHVHAIATVAATAHVHVHT